jgi:hypothetical protein
MDRKMGRRINGHNDRDGMTHSDYFVKNGS